jgi:hypothetical protein
MCISLTHLARPLHSSRFCLFAERAVKPRPKVSTFTTLASSLLVFSHVFKGAVGEAFLGIITASNKYQAANKDIIAAYGKFYNLLLTAGYDNWHSYVLDQVGASRSGHSYGCTCARPVPPACHPHGLTDAPFTQESDAAATALLRRS